MHRDIVGQEGSLSTVVVIPQESPDVRAALDTVAGLPAAIRTQHPTAATADQAEPYAARAVGLPADPNSPGVAALLREVSDWMIARYAHLRRTHKRLAKKTDLAEVLGAIPPSLAKGAEDAAYLGPLAPGTLTRRVALVLKQAWPLIVRGAKAVGRGVVKLVKKHPGKTLATGAGATAGYGLFRGAEKAGKGLGWALLVLLLFLLMKNGG